MSNGNTLSPAPALEGVVGYEPENPFILDGYGRMGRVAEAPSTVPTDELESPFLTEYPVAGESSYGPQAEAFAGFMSELHDEEFSEAVTDLVNEASALAETEFAQEAEPGRQRAVVERGLRDHFAPLVRESEAAIDRLVGGIQGTDLSTLGEEELETLLDRFAPPEHDLSPVFNQFLGKLFKKAKKAVRGAVSIAKKGIALAAKLNPINLVLQRLKKLARPLIERVLRVAIDRLPVAVRPVAQRLAQRFLGHTRQSTAAAAAPQATEPAPTEDPGEQAAADPEEIAQEFDVRLAGGLLGGEAFAQEEAAEQLAEAESYAGEAIQELEHRRRRFAQSVGRLRPGEDPAPVIEEFVPAVLGVLKLGISIAGRPRVVNFLAGLVARLIRKYVGPEPAKTLSRSLVDAGLRLVSLEAEADSEDEAGEALASTVEETVTRVVQTAPASAWESQEMLEGYVREAFASAASAHFPDSMIRSELHEAASTSGVWVAMPRNGKATHYKKYSRALDVSITPQVAAAVKTFGSATLQAVLRDQLRTPSGQVVQARMHLYEALPGSTLSDISFHEKGVAGLGTTRAEAWSLIHPLTPEAAGLLLKEPGLGRPADPKFLADPKVIEVGQRFYYLELPGQSARRGGRRPHRLTRVALDFPKGEVRVLLYFPEADAQALAAKLRARAPLPALLMALKSGLEQRLATILSGAPTKALRLVHEAVPTEQLAAPALGAVMRATGRPVSRLLTRWVLEALKREAGQRYDALAGGITAAANAEADGLTLVIVFQRPAMMERLRKLFAGSPLAAVAAAEDLASQTALASYTLRVCPGYAPC